MEAKGKHRADISAKSATLQAISSCQTSVLALRHIFPIDTFEKLAREAKQLALEKEKQVWKSNNCWFDKKWKPLFRPNNNPIVQETLKFPLLTAVHTINHLTTDKMTAYMYQY